MGWPCRNVLISTRGRINILGRSKEQDLFAWTEKHTLASEQPKLYAISLPKDDLITNVIAKEKIFVVNFFETLMKEKEHDKRKEDARTLDCSRIHDADYHLECEVIDALTTGSTTTFIGKITSGTLP